MIVFDFFAGTKSSTQAFADAGHTVISFELDESFDGITEHGNIMDIDAKYLITKYGRPDFVWASPPCTAFSVASIGHHWASGGEFPVPKTEAAVFNQTIVAHTLNIIRELAPTIGWIMENPVGMLRKLSVVKGLTRNTVTYCQYGETRQKPTDLWGELPNWSPKMMCKRGADCHIAAPRGSRTGTQGIKGAKDRSRVPYELSMELLNAATMKGMNENVCSSNYLQPTLY